MSRKKADRIPFPHPGETLREDFLNPLGMSVNKLALELRVPATRLTEIVRGRRGVTADTALRLARYFNTTPKFWLNLQTSYDLAVAAETRAPEIEQAVHPRGAA
jgi:addiction module HigA family antidote